MHSWDQKAGICPGEKGRDSPVGLFWWPLGTAGPASPHHTLQSAPAQHWVTCGCTLFESSSHRETSCQASKLGPLQMPNPVPGGSDLPAPEGELARGSGQGWPCPCRRASVRIRAGTVHSPRSPLQAAGPGTSVEPGVLQGAHPCPSVDKGEHGLRWVSGVGRAKHADPPGAPHLADAAAGTGAAQPRLQTLPADGHALQLSVATLWSLRGVQSRGQWFWMSVEQRGEGDHQEAALP